MRHRVPATVNSYGRCRPDPDRFPDAGSRDAITSINSLDAMRSSTVTGSGESPPCQDVDGFVTDTEVAELLDLACIHPKTIVRCYLSLPWPVAVGWCRLDHWLDGCNGQPVTPLVWVRSGQ